MNRIFIKVFIRAVVMCRVVHSDSYPNYMYLSAIVINMATVFKPNVLFM